MLLRLALTAVLYVSLIIPRAHALARPDVEFKIFQFPPNMIPTIDGKTDDWNIVPEEYAIGADQLEDTVYHNKFDKSNYNNKVKLGWVKGLDRIYILYQAYDNYWDFEYPTLRNDTFEIIVDADLSGGPLIPELRKDIKLDPWESQMFRGRHAQNYHIFTPAVNKVWTMVWGCNTWLAYLPWSNQAYSYDFKKQGDSGNLVLEFWITPFDYAPFDGPERAVVSKLEENKIIGFSWAILEYDGLEHNSAFWSLSHITEVYGDASNLMAFRLMPLEKRFHEPLEANWSFKVADMDKRLVAFKDESYGNITSWKWDFGDGETSTEQNPIHQYKKPNVNLVVILDIEGPEGKDRLSKVWEVMVK